VKRWLLVLSTVSSLTVQAEEQRLGVLDFQANGASPAFATSAASQVANELQRLGVFQVTTQDAVRELLSHERQKELLGACNSDACASGLPAMANMLGVDYLIGGKVSRLSGSKGMPSSVTFELSLLNVKKGTREASDIQIGQTETELVSKIRKSVIKLVTRLLAGKQGSLLVVASEAGANVKVDDATLGTTPLDGRIPLPSGPHYVQVEKEGFVTIQKEVRILPDQLEEQHVTMVPSPDFIQSYESSEGKKRLAAWICSGVAAAGLAAFTIFEVRADHLYGSPTTPNTFQYHRQMLENGIEVVNGVDQRQAVEVQSQQIATAQNVAYISIAVGAAAAAGATYFWIAGDSPGKYSQFKRLEPSVSVTPTPGGAQTSLGFRW
jgi:hypothetical protein